MSNTSSITDEPDTDRPTVLVVDDDEGVAELYTSFLADRYEVRTALGGEEALALLDEAVDVVLLDRRMPDVMGDDVLEIIRRRNLCCRVAMVTAVDPDLDIIELPFDDYVVKPAGRAELRGTVERLLLVDAHDEIEYELSQLRVKRNVLEAEMSRVELADSEEFAALEARIDELHERLGELREELDEHPPCTPGAA